MLRCILTAGLIFSGNVFLLAEQPKGEREKAKNSSAAPANKADVEAILRSPANLDFKGHDKVTVKDLLTRLRDERKLSIRFDVPTLSRMYGGENSMTSSSEKLSCTLKKNDAEYQAAVATIPGAAVGGLSPDEVKPTPLPPADAKSRAETKLSTITLPLPLNEKGEPMQVEKVRPATAEKCQAVTCHEAHENSIDDILAREVNLTLLDTKKATVATVLRQTLDAFPAWDDGMSDGLPIALTNAANIDYLVEDGGLVVTSKLAALTYKETRVYSLKGLKDIKGEQLSKVICETVRPWSWRSRIDELGNKLKAGGVPLSAEAVTSIVNSGIKLASAEIGIPTEGGAGEEKSDAKEAKDAKMSASEVEQMKLLGNALVDSAVTAAHASLTTLEVVHHADPPTGVVQVLPGTLIITQSQAAHREIAELLKQLSEE